MALDFETFQEEVIEGELAFCQVVYDATIVDVDTEEVVGHAKVIAEKDELIDFYTAVSDEACLPIAEEIEEDLPEYQEVSTLEAKFILSKIANSDGSVTYFAFTPDGNTRIFHMTAEEVFQELMEDLFE